MVGGGKYALALSPEIEKLAEIEGIPKEESPGIV